MKSHSKSRNDIVYNNPSFEIDTIDNLLDIIYEKYPDKKTYLTHISHNMGFHDEVSKKLPENVYLSYDGLEIKIS